MYWKYSMENLCRVSLSRDWGNERDYSMQSNLGKAGSQITEGDGRLLIAVSHGSSWFVTHGQWPAFYSVLYSTLVKYSSMLDLMVSSY